MPKSDSHINKKLNEFSVEFIKENEIMKKIKGREPASISSKILRRRGGRPVISKYHKSKTIKIL